MVVLPKPLPHPTWMTMLFSRFAFVLLVLIGVRNAPAQVVYVVEYASQADVRLYRTNVRSQADIIVYPVAYRSQADAEKGLWFEATYASQADTKVYFVNYRSQADCVVYFASYRSQARRNGCFPVRPGTRTW
jgi:hypothetical protein